MLFCKLPSQLGASFVILGSLVLSASGYFVITYPTAQTTWVNGQPSLVTWKKGLLDGIDQFDIEMSRLSKDGLTLVARNVKSAPGSINILPQDIPTGDDYFLLFINSTHGVMHATSPKFSIQAALPAEASAAPTPNGAVATITVSGAPNPTLPFATTFPSFSGALVRWDVVNGMRGVVGALACVAGAAAWTLA